MAGYDLEIADGKQTIPENLLQHDAQQPLYEGTPEP
jgi:hypothetical protein